MINKIKGLIVSEKGQGMTEYGLILGLIAIAAIGGLVIAGDEISGLFDGFQGIFERETTTTTTP
ncbi:pilus assembly protein Flp/PilA [Gracilibacillus ureilyticus]|uniref:Pilus assembly protein Flp/PilA n=1 Tax=Gracilibacillus ureilyticus TaxID=531814 RepID=A0A1H9V5Q8_9BACI|nr:Flp family type IVb pilin [Gracilibacillus ureilyticus]SES16577.1 pilus assembly protein Flp/PilA [Gracilibacillus ureilyticus]